VIASLAPAAAFIGFYRQRLVSKPSGESDMPRLRVMTLNVLCRDRSAAKTVEAIRESDADVVMLQEVLPAMGRALAKALVDDYPYQAIHPAYRARGTAVLSRIPLEYERKLLLSADGWYCQEVRICWSGRPIVMFNVHLMSPLKLFPRRGERHYDERTRTAEMQLLIERLQALEGFDVIVAGDFNMTDQSRDFRAIRAQARDAFIDAGSGFGFTYPAGTPHAKHWHERLAPPVLRLDHVFYRGRLRARSASVGPNGDSDHYSVIVDLEALEDERFKTGHL
jgi:endonuclease/exonuclease/phosphatase (EEP) superfamily protein YafD